MAEPDRFVISFSMKEGKEILKSLEINRDITLLFLVAEPLKNLAKERGYDEEQIYDMLMYTQSAIKKFRETLEKL